MVCTSALQSCNKTLATDPSISNKQNTTGKYILISTRKIKEGMWAPCFCDNAPLSNKIDYSQNNARNKKPLFTIFDTYTL